MIARLILCSAWVLLSSGRAPAAEEYTTESLRGKVLWTGEALLKLHGIETDADAARNSVSLVTRDGHVHPIVKDARGRGFQLDARLRDRDFELFVRRHAGSPFIQVIRIYTFKEGRKHELDYWCDICAIAMYELKECECCQGPIRIRERPIEEASK
jgi:hypothetical protein